MFVLEEIAVSDVITNSLFTDSPVTDANFEF